MNVIEQIEREQVAKLTESRDVPELFARRYRARPG